MSDEHPNPEQQSEALPTGASLSGRRRLGAMGWTVMGAVVAVIAPALLLGPWLPLIDIVSFVGLYSYPPQQSYGPLHYYTFQFAYTAVLTVSRVLCDLQVPVRYQVPLYYVIQMVACVGIVAAFLRRMVGNAWLRSLGIALGAIALWDGVFLWGGALGYSLGARCLTLAAFVMIRDTAEPGKYSGALFAALLVIGMWCHPFMYPFVLLLCGVRFLFDARHRWHTAAVAAGATLFALIIIKDSPASEVGTATGGIWHLFGFSFAQIWNRLSGLFLQDALFANTLFGSTPASSEAIFFVFALLHLFGFVVSPYLAVTERRSVWLRMLMTLDACVGVMYLFAWDVPQNPIGEWPQRVLTAFAPITYLGGFLSVLYVIEKFRPGACNPDRRVSAGAWSVPAAILVLVVVVQAQIFAFGGQLSANINRTREQILQTGVSNCYLVVAGIDNIKPFYLRCIPFALFSDRALAARNILINTEWHVQARHPTHLVESSFDLGRKRYLAEFSSAEGIVSVQLTEQPRNRFPVHERTNEHTWLPPAAIALDEFKEGVRLFNLGLFGAAFQHFNTAIYMKPDFADAWNNAGASLYRAGNRADAITCYKKAIELQPNDIDARVNLAGLWAEIGDKQQAAAEAKEILRIDPKNEKARAVLDQSSAAAPAK